jgi:hypothetical protein
MPDRLPSAILLFGFWIPPAAIGWAAAELAHRGTTRARAALTYTRLMAFVVAWSAIWFFFQIHRMPPYIPGMVPEDPTYAPPQAVAGLLVVAGALVLPGSALACVLAFRGRRRSLGRSSMARPST